MTFKPRPHSGILLAGHGVRKPRGLEELKGQLDLTVEVKKRHRR